MADYQLLIIGGGLSGLAAGIRAARFGRKTLIVEQHALPGGLNSYYQRQGYLLETGLHAMTNFATPENKHAPLNRLFRQLHLSRREFVCREQVGSLIRFPHASLSFTNDPSVLIEEIGRHFPACLDRFQQLRREIARLDPFAAGPWRSARQFVLSTLQDQALTDMLLLPLMVYGNAEEHDMDLRQFVIMFRAVFEEGFFRPQETIREFLDLLIRQYHTFQGELRYRSPVASILFRQDRAVGVRLANGEEITADAVLSTVGLPETIRLTSWPVEAEPHTGRMSFLETISLVPSSWQESATGKHTIIFYNTAEAFHYRRPDTLADTSWGVICFPDHFIGQPECELKQIRVTNPANYTLWQQLGPGRYRQEKQRQTTASVQASEEIIGNYRASVVYQDSFTPLTIERFTRKAQGAVYGSPIKIRDGRTPWPNLFLAGTDQGYLGIVGAMLSGVTIVNNHLLS